MRKRPSTKFCLMRALLLAAVVTIPTTWRPASAQNIATATTATPATAGADTKLPVYDVASVKPNKSGEWNVSVTVHAGNFEATNVSLKSLLEDAYGIRSDLISGGFGWVEVGRFDINAKVVKLDEAEPKELTDEQWQPKPLAGLQDRFRLKAHLETKEISVYELIVAKNGPKFKESAPEKPEDKSDTSKRATTARKMDGPDRGGIWVSNNELTANAIHIKSLTGMLSHQLHRTVISKTGLTGEYDLSLKWSRDDSAHLDDGTKDSAPSIFTALQEQLGLKLQPSKAPSKPSSSITLNCRPKIDPRRTDSR